MNFATLHFDTYKVVNLLKERGFTKKQAEGIMEAVQEVTISGVATKEDVQSIKEDVQSVRDDMHNLEIGLRAEIQKIDAKIDKKIDDQKIWFLGAMLTQTFALVAVILTVAFRVL